MRAAMMALRPASAALNLHAARRTGATPARRCWRPVSASAGARRGYCAACCAGHACVQRLKAARPRASRQAAAGDAGGGLKPELRAAIDKFVNENKVVLFMKGTKQFPQVRVGCVRSAARAALTVPACVSRTRLPGVLTLNPPCCCLVSPRSAASATPASRC